MSKQPCFWDAEDRLKEISAKGDPLETLAEAVDFKRFKPILEKAAGRPRSPKGGRPSFDPVLKFKMLVLQSLRGLSLEATEKMVRDRPGWMRFCGLEMCDRVPDANTLRDFREAPVKAGAFDDLFKELNQAVDEAGCILRSGQIVDASLVAAPRQRNTDGEKAAIKDGRSAGEIWPDSPAKASQKDTDARWMVKSRKGKPGPDGKKRLDIAIPVFGCKTRICIDRKHGIIRSQIAASASDGDGARVREGLVQRNNTSGDVWGDTAYRPAENEKWLEGEGLRSRIHRKKPNGRPMSARTAKANGRKSAARSKVEHVFARQKTRMGLAIRTIGLDRAKATAALANMAAAWDDCDGCSARSSPHDRMAPGRGRRSRNGRNSKPRTPQSGRKTAGIPPNLNTDHRQIYSDRTPNRPRHENRWLSEVSSLFQGTGIYFLVRVTLQLSRVNMYWPEMLFIMEGFKNRQSFSDIAKF